MSTRLISGLLNELLSHRVNHLIVLLIYIYIHGLFHTLWVSDIWGWGDDCCDDKHVIRFVPGLCYVSNQRMKSRGKSVALSLIGLAANTPLRYSEMVILCAVFLRFDFSSGGKSTKWVPNAYQMCDCMGQGIYSSITIYLVQFQLQTHWGILREGIRIISYLIEFHPIALQTTFTLVCNHVLNSLRVWVSKWTNLTFF